MNSVAETARALREGDTSPLALLEAFRERMERLNPKLNAFVTIDMPGAEKAAAEAEKRWKEGRLQSVFDGIPVALKDLFHVQGVRTTAGSKIFADFVPEDDAAVVSRLKAAGAVVVGMTNTHEFALGTTTENPHYGPTRNPWDTGRVPGGFQRGLGGRGGGGARTRGHGNGHGRIDSHPRGAVRPRRAQADVRPGEPAGNFSPQLVFGSCGADDPYRRRRGADAANFGGPDPRDATTLAAPPVLTLAAIGEGLAGLKVGVPTRWFFERVEPGVEAAVRDAVNVLRDAGAQVVEVDWPDDEEAEGIVAITSLIMSTEGGDVSRSLFERPGR